MAELILAVIPLALKSIDRVSTFFGRLQNAPRRIQFFRSQISHLKENLQHLQDEVVYSPVSLNLNPEMVEQVSHFLERARRFFDGYKPTGSAVRAGALSAIWTLKHDEELEEYSKEIHHISHRVILVWLRLICSRQRGPPEQQMRIQNDTNALASEIENLSLTDLHRPGANNGSGDLVLAQVAAIHGVDPTLPITIEQKLKEIDNKIRKYMADLKIPVNDIMDNVTIADEAAFRNVDMTLKLERVPSYEILHLEQMQIISLDKDTVVLFSQRRDQSIRVKHLMSRHTTPFTPDITSRHTSFLSSHCITVIDRGTHHLYHVSEPRYSFQAPQKRKRFQSVLRERDLLAEFEASDITWGGKPVGPRAQVLQFWGPSKGSTEVTITVLVEGEEGVKHTEWFIGDFKDGVEVKVRKMSRFTKGRTKVVARLMPLYRQESPAGDEDVVIAFSGQAEAERFKHSFKKHYPLPIAGGKKPELRLDGWSFEDSPDILMELGL